MKRAWRWPLALLAPILLLSNGLADLGDIPFTRKATSGDTPTAVFPHAVHRAQFKCYVCHDALFRMQSGANRVTMDAISQGKFCGACHDGKTAFPVAFETCGRCHRE